MRVGMVAWGYKKARDSVINRPYNICIYIYIYIYIYIFIYIYMETDIVNCAEREAGPEDIYRKCTEQKWRPADIKRRVG